MVTPHLFYNVMHFIYLLQSRKNNQKFYIGITSNLKKRITEHNNGESVYTNRYKPWEIIYFEAFLSRDDARNRERALKHHGKGLAELKKRLRHSIRRKKVRG